MFNIDVCNIINIAMAACPRLGMFNRLAMSLVGFLKDL